MSSPLHVDVWTWALDVDPARQARLAAWLTEDERKRAAAFATERLRGRWAVARAGLRAVLGREIGVSPDTLAFSYGEFGKPALVNGSEALHFNLSHSEDLAVLALCVAPVGVDVERIGGPHEDVAQRYFSAAEAAAFLATPEAERAEAFYRCWTAKEAFLKALGTGFSRRSDSFTINYPAAAPPRLVDVDWLGEPLENWAFDQFRPAPGYMGAVAVRTPAQVVKAALHGWSE